MLSQSLGIHQTQGQTQNQSILDRRTYVREALKAFKKIQVEGRPYYTCNVARLKACDRLGDEKQVTTWRTHFFLNSRHFSAVEGVIFNSAPGRELADFSRGAVEVLCVSIGPREIINSSNGNRTTLEEDLVFASDDGQGE